jgi:opacity protein-like surface antigen
MRNGKTLAPITLMLIGIWLLCWHRGTSAETAFSLYGGTSFTRNSDLHLTRPERGTAATVKDVKWDADPFKAAPYYGLRFTHFFDQVPNWGVALDFTHYKMYAQTDRVVSVNGAWKGAAINTTAPMNRYVQRFEISHGVNMLSVNGIYRWLNTGVGGNRIQPYVGAGLVYYRTHSENAVDNAPHETGYQSSGVGYQLLGGVQYRLSQRWGAFVEAKFNGGTAKVDIDNGRAETSLRTIHGLVGISYSF